MRAPIVALPLAFLLAGSVAPALAAPARTSVSFHDVGLRSAVAEVSKSTGVVFRLEDPVPNVPVTFELRKAPVDDIAHILLRIGRTSVPGLELTRDGAAYVFRVGSSALPDPAYNPQDPGLQIKVTVSTGPTTLRNAFKILMEGTEMSGVVLPAVPNPEVKLELKDAPLKDALDELMRQAYVTQPSLYLGQEGSVLVIGLRSAPAAVVKSASTPGVETKGNLNLRDVGLRSALRILFRLANGTDGKLTCEVSPDLPDKKLTLNLKDVTFDEAIETVMKAVREQGVALHRERKDEAYRFLPGD